MAYYGAQFGELAGRVFAEYPVRVHWAGFRSDTISLAKEGWRIATRSDFLAAIGTNQVSVVLCNPNKTFVMQGGVSVSDMKLHALQPGGLIQMLQAMRFELEAQPLCDIIAYGPVGNFREIEPAAFIDVKNPKQSIFEVFRAKGDALGNDLIIKPKKIGELLDFILDAQETTKIEIDEREKTRAYKNYGRILTLAEAA